MKKTLLAITISLFAMSSYANTLVTCEGTTNPDRTLILAIRNGKLLQLRVQNQGSLPRVLMTNVISANANTTIYTIMGSIDLLELQNSVLSEGSGEARMAGERFNCFEN